jgi:cobalt/nickel transport system permease protein
MIAVVTSAPRPAALVAPAVILLGVAACARVGAGSIARGMAPALPALVAFGLFLPFLPEGREVWRASLGPLTLAITEGGLAKLAVVATRALLCLAALVLLVRTTPLARLAGTLSKVLPVALVETIFVTCTQMGILAQEVERATMARALRDGGRLRWGLRLRMGASLVARLFFAALERGEVLYGAMLCRGFDGTIPLPTGRRPGIADALLALAAVAALVSGRLA